MNTQDGRAMFELQLELHARVAGVTPPITADELFELHELLAESAGDVKSLLAETAT